MVTPQPAHHLWKDRLEHLLAVPLDAPRIVHVVALFGKGLLHPDILVEPVAPPVVGSVGSQRPIVIPAINQKNTYGFLLALAYDVRIGVTPANIRKTAHVAYHLAEMVGTLP